MRGQQHSAWPSSLQELLLRAALLHGDEARTAWNHWAAMVELDTIDWGSKRLLAATYANLVDLEIEHPFMHDMKEYKQKTWLETQLLFHQTEPAIRALEDAGIPTMLTKGAALVLRHYRDYGLRPMADFDVVVPTEQAGDAMATLEANGFQLMPEHAQLDDLKRLHAATFVTDIGRQLDLHRHVIGGCPDDGPFWNNAVPVVLGDTNTMTLSPTELLLHVCVHGVRANPVPPIRWVVDSAVIIRGGEVNWDRLVRASRKFRFSHRMRAALVYLDRFDVGVPALTIERLSEGDRVGLERREFERITRSRSKSVGTQLAAAWLGFERFVSTERGLRRIVYLPEYLRSMWGIESTWKLPFMAAKKVTRRLVG